MKYNIGDKVRIVDKFPPHSHDVISMRDYLGKVVTIINRDDAYGGRYWIKEDGGSCYWLEQTIAGYPYKITLEEFWNNSGNRAIHCDNEADAKILCAAFHRLDKSWCDNKSYCIEHNWTKYGSNTCYSNSGHFGQLSWYHTHGYEVFKFEEVNLGEPIIPEDAMQILCRNTTRWKRVSYDKTSNSIRDEVGNKIPESEIMAIKNDERKGYVRCSFCKEIIDNNPEEIAAHFAKKKNCLKCDLVRSNKIKDLNITYEAQDDGTYIERREASCNLFCGNGWGSTNINSPSVVDGCKYRGCDENTMKPLAGFFAEYPDAFNTIATVDALGDNWEFDSRNRDSYCYKFKGRTRLFAYMNTSGVITEFTYYLYDDVYTFTYSAKYQKLVWISGGQYNVEVPYGIKERNITMLTNIMKEIYEEKTK